MSGWDDAWAVSGQSGGRGTNGDNVIGTALGRYQYVDHDQGAGWPGLGQTHDPNAWSNAASSSPRIGPDIGILEAYAKRSKGARVCKDCVGGSAIATWISTYAPRHIATMQATGWSFGGLIWVQGEEDAKSSSASAAYQASLGTLFGLYRAAFPALKVCIVKLAGDFTPLSGTAPYIDDIRAAQVAYAASDALCTIVDGDEYDGLQHDGVHRTGPQNRVIGARALAALEAM